MKLVPTLKEKQSLVLQRRKELQNKPTRSELEMKRKLEKLDIQFIFQKGFIAGDGFCIADFYCPKLKLVIEVDGEYHLLYNQKKDRWKNEYLTKFRKFAVLRISNDDVWAIGRATLTALIRSCERGMVTYSSGYFKNHK